MKYIRSDPRFLEGFPWRTDVDWTWRWLLLCTDSNSKWRWLLLCTDSSSKWRWLLLCTDSNSKWRCLLLCTDWKLWNTWCYSM